MFQILSGSTPAAAKNATTDSLDYRHVGEMMGGDGFFDHIGGSAVDGDQEKSNSNNSSNKKRNRRRRKGKSRTKVEPILSSPKCVTKAFTTSSNSKKQHDAPMTKRDLYFALDCEMVGVGPDGLTSAVGRVTVVNWENQIVLDTYVMVPAPVTDYRTHVSGITPEHLQPRPGHPLMTFSEVRAEVQSILRGKILIGHGLENDLTALGLYHPWTDIRDTATYSFFMREYYDPVTQSLSLRPKKLQDLAWEQLGKQIQMPGVPHSPVEDACTALDLYKEVRGQWEDHLIRVAQQKEKEQQQQLLERQQQQQQQQQQLLERQQQQQRVEQQRQQQQQQQQQIRKWQWLAASSPPLPQPMFPGQQPHAMMHPAAMQTPPPPTYPYRSGMMPPQNPGVLAFVQTSTPPQPPQPMRSSSSSSSWFGFSRKAKQSPRRIPRSISRESIATQCTMTTVQSSFSQEYTGFSSPRGGAWHVQEEDDLHFDHEQMQESSQIRTRQFATEASQEMALETTAGKSIGVIVDGTTSGPTSFSLMADETEATDCTESTECATSSTSDPLSLPTDYEPPRYFTNPDPEPMSSSSWFKLWGSRSKGQDGSSVKGGDESDAEMDDSSEKPRRSSESEAASSTYSLFSGHLFPRRASESCMAGMVEKEIDEHSRSLH